MIEVMASVAIIAFAMVGIFSLTIYNQRVFLNTKNQFTAAMLAQEGVELVRNVRDSNWLNSLAFNDGIDGAVFRVDSVDIKSSIQPLTGINDAAATLKLLGGVYRHDAGEATAFARAIFTEALDELGGNEVDGMQVTSLVQWQERGETRARQTTVLLYDWRQ